MPGVTFRPLASKFSISGEKPAKLNIGIRAERWNGGDWRIVAEFTEVESGKRRDRPKLEEALEGFILLADHAAKSEPHDRKDEQRAMPRLR